MTFRFLRNLFIVLSSVLSVFIFYTIWSKGISTDIYAHTRMIARSIEYHTLPANFLYYFTVYFFNGFKIDLDSLYKTGLVLLSFSVVFKFIFSSKIVFSFVFDDIVNLSKSKIFFIFLVLFLLLIIHPIISPLDLTNGRYYLGKAAINIWHNSTTIFVMPFVILLYYNSCKYITKPKITNLYLVLIFGILIVLIKPSFIFCFLVAFPVLLFSRFKYSKTFFIGIIFLAVLSLLIAFEYYSIYILNDYGVILYNSEQSRIGIAPFQEWAHYSENIFFDLLTSITFPLLFSIFYFPVLKNELTLKYAWVLLFIGLIIAILFFEDGPRMWNWNFFWQVPMTNYLLFLISTMLFLKILFLKKIFSVKDSILIFFWFCHVASGIIYLRKFLFLLDYH